MREVAAVSFLPARLRFVKPDGATGPAPFDRVIVVRAQWPLTHPKLEVLRSLERLWDRKAAA